jgi:hypothetical protein
MTIHHGLALSSTRTHPRHRLPAITAADAAADSHGSGA